MSRLNLRISHPYARGGKGGRKVQSGTGPTTLSAGSTLGDFVSSTVGSGRSSRSKTRSSSGQDTVPPTASVPGSPVAPATTSASSDVRRRQPLPEVPPGTAETEAVNKHNPKAPVQSLIEDLEALRDVVNTTAPDRWSLETLQPLLEESKRRQEALATLHAATSHLLAVNQQILYDFSRHKGWLVRDHVSDVPSQELAESRQRVAELEQAGEVAQQRIAELDHKLTHLQAEQDLLRQEYSRTVGSMASANAVADFNAAGNVIMAHYGRLLCQLGEFDRYREALSCGNELRAIPETAWRDFFPAEVWGSSEYRDPCQGIQQIAFDSLVAAQRHLRPTLMSPPAPFGSAPLGGAPMLRTSAFQPRAPSFGFPRFPPAPSRLGIRPAPLFGQPVQTTVPYPGATPGLSNQFSSLTASAPFPRSPSHTVTGPSDGGAPQQPPVTTTGS